MLDKQLIGFLANEMCIDVRELIDKICQPNLSNHATDLFRVIGEFRGALDAKNAECRIQKIFTKYEAFFESEEAYGVLDSLRHAFDGFAFGGLHQLFTRQENEVWYPKIILVDELLPNDISSLGQEVVIFRGCSVSEYASGVYGQSWTTSQEVANQFAYVHYRLQSWFVENDRVVVKSSIPKSAIFYSDQKVEFEVVVELCHLGRTELCV